MRLFNSIKGCEIATVIFLLGGQNTYAVDVCSDSYISAEIQPFANDANSAVGECQIAKAGIALYEKSIELVKPCINDPELVKYKIELEQLLTDAENMANSYCG